MAQLLDDSAIETALTVLPRWRRVENTLVRDVALDRDAADDLEAAVATAADELNHHPVVDRTGDGLRFTVWTHSDGGLTGKDVALATRIEETIDGAVEAPPT